MSDLKGDTTSDLVNTRYWPTGFYWMRETTTPTRIFYWCEGKKENGYCIILFLANFLVNWSALTLSVACIMMEPIFVDGICLKGQRWNKIAALAAGNAAQRSSKWKIWLKWSWSVSFTLVGWHPKVIAGFHGEFYNSLRWWTNKLKLQKDGNMGTALNYIWQQCWYCNYSPE